MPRAVELSVCDLRKLVDCDFETGKVIWRERPRELFLSDCNWKIWNNRFAGKPAFKCNKSGGYLGGKIFGRHYPAHRVLWAVATGSWPRQQIDHINGIKTDNRLCNLRAVTARENMKNRAIPSHNTSGVVGVGWHKASGKWQAQVQVNGRAVYLGLFADINEAITARQAASIKYGYHQNHGRPSRRHLNGGGHAHR